MRTLVAIALLSSFSVPALADAGCGQPITTVYSRSLNQANASGEGGTSFREPVTLAGAGDTLRITLAGSTGAAVKYDHVAVALQASGPNGTAMPVEVRFGGASGATAPAGAGGSIASDWIAAPSSFGSGQVVLVIADVNIASNTMDFAIGSGTSTYYRAATASFNQQSVTGFSPNPNYFAVAKIEAMTCGELPPPVPAPTVVAGMFPFGASFECLGGPVPSPLPANPQAGDSRFQYAVTLHGPAQFTLAARGGQVALMGDSVLAKNDAALLPGAYDYGVSGLTIPGLINLVAAGNVPSYTGWPGLTSLHLQPGTRSGCRAVVLEIGINDLDNLAAGTPGWSMSMIQANYQLLLGMLTGPTVIVLPLPTGDPTLNSFALQFNAWVKSTFAARQNTVILDEWPWMSSGIPATLSPATCQTAPNPSNGGLPDNVHPVGACALRLMTDIRVALQQLQ